MASLARSARVDNVHALGSLSYKKARYPARTEQATAFSRDVSSCSSCLNSVNVNSYHTMSSVVLSGEYNTGFQIAAGGSHNIYNNYQAGQSCPQNNVTKFCSEFIALPVRPASRPSLVIPFGRDKDFIVRGDVLDQINHHLDSAGSRVALVGLGGIGSVQSFKSLLD